jgi:hypothetical protein
VLANKNLQENLAACNAVAERVLARMTEPGPIDSRELKTLAQVLAREFDVVTKLLGSREPRAA